MDTDMGWPPEKLENMLHAAIVSLNNAIDYSERQMSIMPIMSEDNLKELIAIEERLEKLIHVLP